MEQSAEQADAPDAGVRHDEWVGDSFYPGPNLSPRFATRGPVPSWLAVSIAVTVALLLGVSLAVRPATAVAHGAVGGEPPVEAVARQDLFQLPEWHDDAADAHADAPAEQASASPSVAPSVVPSVAVADAR